VFKTRIKFDGKKVTLKAFGVRPLQMLQLGRAGLAHVKQRVAQGVGLEDSPMRPLKQYRRIVGRSGKVVNLGPVRGYPGRKLKAGKRDIRDLNFTGAMLENLSVRNASENEVRIGFTTKLARQKALANQQREPWLGWSASDSKAVVDKAQQVFKNSVQQYFKEAKRQFRRAA
jgi:hypothetical protein